MKYIKLNELCGINIGKTPSRNKSEYWSGGSPWLAISDLQKSRITKTKEKITERAIEECNMKIVPKDTVVMSFKLSIGKTAILDKDMYTNEAIANFPIKDKNKLIPEYLYYALNTINFNNTDRAVMGATLNKAKLNELKIPYCKFENQVQIVSILDKSQQLIDKRKEQIQALDELVKSKFIEMFGVYFSENYLKELDSVSVKITDGEHGTVPRVESGIPYLMARNISNNNSLNLNEVSYIDKDIHRKIYSRCNPEYGDLLLVCVGATIGKVTLVPNIEEFSMARSVALVKYDREVISGQYLLWLFNHNYMKIQLKNSSNESAQAGLYIGKIKKLKIPVPPLELQNQFADFVKQVDKLKSEMEDSLKELDDSFNSLMQRAFKGELFQ